MANTIPMEKLAELAKLALSEEELMRYQSSLSNILALAKEMMSIDTDHIQPAAHAFDCVQRLRPDLITEPDQRELFQAGAPQVSEGLYGVPLVIEE